MRPVPGWRSSLQREEEELLARASLLMWRQTERGWVGGWVAGAWWTGVGGRGVDMGVKELPLAWGQKNGCIKGRWGVEDRRRAHTNIAPALAHAVYGAMLLMRVVNAGCACGLLMQVFNAGIIN